MLLDLLDGLQPTLRRYDSLRRAQQGQSVRRMQWRLSRRSVVSLNKKWIRDMPRVSRQGRLVLWNCLIEAKSHRKAMMKNGRLTIRSGLVREYVRSIKCVAGSIDSIDIMEPVLCTCSTSRCKKRDISILRRRSQLSVCDGILRREICFHESVARARARYDM